MASRHQVNARIGTNLPSCFLAAAVAIFLLVLPSKLAWSQDFRQYRDYDRYRYLPRMPEGPENPPPLTLEEREVTGDPKVLVEELKGLIFVDDPSLVVERPDAVGVQIQSESNLGLLQSYEFQQLAESYLGGTVSIRRLNELVRAVIRFYRDSDQPVVNVTIPPEQDITDGIVQVIVTEARVGQVIVQGTNYFKPQVLVNQVWTYSGDRIYESDLQEDVRWLIRNPFRRVDLELSPGDLPGETDVIFNVQDMRPVRAYAGYEDTGNRLNGLERTFYGVNWYNALWRDDQVGYQYTASSDFKKFDAHSAFYSTALHNRDILTLYATHAEFNTPIPGFFIGPFPLANEGTIWQLLPRWYRELCPIGCYEHSITAGFDYKRINTGIIFNGQKINPVKADVAQFMVGYTGKMYDSLGSWFVGVDGYFSPGHLSGRNTSANFQGARPGASASYAYGRGFFERRICLTPGLEFVGRITGQLSEGNLLPTEQLGFGGYNSIRGFDMYSVVADSGYFANLEIWTEPFYLNLGERLHMCDEFGVPEDELRFLAFYDFGDAYNHTVLPFEDPSVDLQGVGVGLRYNLQRRFTLRADYGWQITQLIAQPTPRERWHIGAVVSY